MLFPFTVSAAPLSADSFKATDAAATSTFAGNIKVDGNTKLTALGLGFVSSNANGLLHTGTVASPLTLISNVLGCALASGSQTGCLSAADWTRFNATASSSSGTPAGANGQIQFNDNGAFGANNNLVFDTSSGFLGVGTSTQYHPNEKWDFTAQTDDGFGSNLYTTNYGGHFPFAAVSIRTARGTQAAPAAIHAGDFLGRYTFNGFDGTQFQALASAGISGIAAENWTEDTRGTSINFVTTDIGTNSRTEKMRLTSDGKLGIGATAPTSNLEVTSEGVTTLKLDSASETQGSCIIMKDSDGVGYTYITANDGVLSASTVPCN